MEYICVGGSADGTRVTDTYPPKEYITLYQQEGFHPKYSDPIGIPSYAPQPITCDSYRLERLSTVKTEFYFYFYVASNLSLESALDMLLSNYAIGDPTKRRRY